MVSLHVGLEKEAFSKVDVLHMPERLFQVAPQCLWMFCCHAFFIYYFYILLFCILLFHAFFIYYFYKLLLYTAAAAATITLPASMSWLSPPV